MPTFKNEMLVKRESSQPVTLSPLESRAAGVKTLKAFNILALVSYCWKVLFEDQTLV